MNTSPLYTKEKKEAPKYANISQTLRQEITFDLGNFNTLDTKDDVYGLVRVIENLLFMKPGTFPDAPNMGIHMEQYMHNILNIETIENIKTNIQQQSNDYIGNNVITEIEIRQYPGNTKNKNVLGIGMKIGKINKPVIFFLSTEKATGKLYKKVMISN